MQDVEDLHLGRAGFQQPAMPVIGAGGQGAGGEVAGVVHRLDLRAGAAAVLEAHGAAAEPDELRGDAFVTLRLTRQNGAWAAARKSGTIIQMDDMTMFLWIASCPVAGPAQNVTR